jgi:hypothetical protein
MIWLPSKNGGKNPAENPAETAHLDPQPRTTTNMPGTRKSRLARIVAGEPLNPDFAQRKPLDLAQPE